MNFVNVYDKDENLKYRFSSIWQKDNDGLVKSANAFFASDDTGAELESGTGEFIVRAKNNNLIFAEDDIFEIFSKEKLMGRFYIETADKISLFDWRVQGIDDIGRAENIALTASKTPLYRSLEEEIEGQPLGSYLRELMTNAEIAVNISQEVENTIVEGGVIPHKTTLREVAQAVGLDKGVLFLTFGRKIMEIIKKPLKQKIIHKYSAKQLFNDPIFEKKQILKNIIQVVKPQKIGDSSYGYIFGYAPIGNYEIITPYIDPIISVNPKVDSVFEKPKNDFYKKNEIILVTANESFLELSKGRKISEYFTTRITPDNKIVYSIDIDALNDVYEDSGEGKYIDENGKEYALIGINFQYGGEYTNKSVGIINAEQISSKITTVELPFPDDNTVKRIKKYFTRKEFIKYKVSYTGEDLGEIVKMPDELRANCYAIINKIDLKFSANKVFANITADILPEEEKKNVKKYSTKYGSGVKYGSGAKYGSYEIYEEE